MFPFILSLIAGCILGYKEESWGIGCLVFGISWVVSSVIDTVFFTRMDYGNSNNNDEY